MFPLRFEKAALCGRGPAGLVLGAELIVPSRIVCWEIPRSWRRSSAGPSLTSTTPSVKAFSSVLEDASSARKKHVHLETRDHLEMDDLRQELLCHRRRFWQEAYTPQSPTDKLLSHIRQSWVEFCDDPSISPVTGLKNYLEHEARFLKYLKGRDSCDDTSLGRYQRFFRHLAVEDLGDAPDEAAASPLGQLLRDLQAVEVTTLTDQLGEGIFQR